MKKIVGVVVGFSAPIVGLLLDIHLLKDSDLFSLPLTLLGVSFIGLGYFMWEAFKRGAMFSTPTLFTETHRLNRFKDEIQIVNDGDIHWVVVPVGGFQYLKAYLAPKNFTQGRGHIVIMPARLLEIMGSRFNIGRVQLVELELNAIRELYKIGGFRRVFNSFEHFPTKLYLGIASKTLHTDAEDLKRANISGLGKILEDQEAELGRAARQLDIKLDDDLSKLERAKTKGEISRKIAQAFDSEHQTGQEAAK